MLERASRHDTPVVCATLASETRRLNALFTKSGLETPALDARLLAAEACGLSASEAIVNAGAKLTAAQQETLKGYLDRRLAGEPVSRILGWREFWGLRFILSPATLDPRPETELLVEIVLEHIRKSGEASKPLRLLDLGTGSGCLLAALLSELPLGCGVGIDRSEAALTAARENLCRLGLFDRVSLLCGDWLNALSGAEFDIIVCNPPYIEAAAIEALSPEVRCHDPCLALDGGPDGLDAYRRVIPEAWNLLSGNGILALETGCGQSGAVRDILQQTGAARGSAYVEIRFDLSGADRAVAGVRQL